MKKIIILFSLSLIAVCSNAQTPCNKLYNNIYSAFSPCPNPSAYACTFFDNTTDDSTVTIRNLGGSGVDIQAVVNCSTDSIHIPMQTVQGTPFVGEGQLFPYHKIIITYTIGDTSGSITCTDTLFTNNPQLISKNVNTHSYSITNTNNSIQITDDIAYTHINIYSMAGALLVKEKLFNNRLDNLNLAPSFYIVEISGKKNIIREKILIR